MSKDKKKKKTQLKRFLSVVDTVLCLQSSKVSIKSLELRKS